MRCLVSTAGFPPPISGDSNIWIFSRGLTSFLPIFWILPLLLKLLEYEAKEIFKTLSAYEPILDERLEVTPGYKFNEWELKGIPIRIEIGPNDLKKNQVIMFRRDTEKKEEVKIKDIKKETEKLLEDIQNNLFKNAEALLKKNLDKAETFEEAKKKIKDNKIVLVPMKNSQKVEDSLKEKIAGVKTLNIPLNQPAIKGKKCIISKEQADYWVYVGKSY